MVTYITVPLPEHIQRQMDTLAHENFNLWLFIAQNDLLDDARDFLSLPDPDLDDPENLPF